VQNVSLARAGNYFIDLFHQDDQMIPNLFPPKHAGWLPDNHGAAKLGCRSKLAGAGAVCRAESAGQRAGFASSGASIQELAERTVAIERGGGQFMVLS